MYLSALLLKNQARKLEADVLKHYVEFAFPGCFFNEYESQEVPERNPEVINVPENAFAFRFYDRTEVTMDGELLIGEKKNYSPWTYFGTAYTVEEIKANFPQYQTLISNMENNGWDRAVKTRAGNWQPLEENDIVI